MALVQDCNSRCGNDGKNISQSNKGEGIYFMEEEEEVRGGGTLF